MKISFWVISLLFLIACESSETPQGTTSEQYGICSYEGERNCIKSMNWHIFVKKSNFPKNVLISVNDTIVKNECNGVVTNHQVKRENGYTVINLIDFLALKSSSKVSLLIMNLGDSCLGNETYYYESNQSFDINVEEGATSVSIDI